MHVRVAAPDGLPGRPGIVGRAQRGPQPAGSTMFDRPREAVAGADVGRHRHLGVDGPGGEAERVAPFVPYAVTGRTDGLAAPDAIVLHCLPAYRGKEIAAA